MDRPSVPEQDVGYGLVLPHLPLLWAGLQQTIASSAAGEDRRVVPPNLP